MQLAANELIALALLPITGAFIGWVTNWVAIKMLFRPRTPMKVLGISFHGVVPRRQKDLAAKIANTIEERLISSRDVEEILQSKQTEAQIERVITEQLDIFLSEKLRFVPMAEMFLHGSIAQQVKGLMVTQFRSAIPSLVDGLIHQVEDNLSFRDIVRTKIESFELQTLEEMIYGICARELRTIELLGAVLGFVVGALQAGLMLVF